MIWDENTISFLKTLWIEGHSTAEIGRRLGISKNAVVGKAHRVDLDARPSPISRPAGYSPREPKLRPPPQPLAVLPSLRELPPPPALSVAPIVPAPLADYRPPQPKPLPTPRPVTRRCPSECCWPIGEVGKPSFRFCGDPSDAGRPYCGEHSKLAYMKIRDRDDREGDRL